MFIGFMQGRLSDRIDEKIQAFPWLNWEREFEIANQLDFKLIEWTLDQDRLYENPLMTPDGRRRISELSQTYNLRVYSLTGDCFMQAPFHKSEGEQKKKLILDFNAIIHASADIGIRYIVMPLVDNGSINSNIQAETLKKVLMPYQSFLVKSEMKILFESDLPAQELRRFINQYPEDAFGINYDIGNSAALGFDPEEEIDMYGHRIDNVHIKDRILNGKTVPLGEGNANFIKVFASLKKKNYAGNFILQTARAEDDDHAGVLRKYKDMSIIWATKNGFTA